MPLKLRRNRRRASRALVRIALRDPRSLGNPTIAAPPGTDTATVVASVGRHLNPLRSLASPSLLVNDGNGRGERPRPRSSRTSLASEVADEIGKTKEAIEAGSWSGVNGESAAAVSRTPDDASGNGPGCERLSALEFSFNRPSR